MSNSLYKITSNFVSLFEKAQNGEINEQEFAEMGNELAIELKNKSTNVIAYIQDQDALLNSIKAEEERLKAYRKSCEQKLEKFKEYVKGSMETLELSEISTGLGVLKITKNPASVEIYDESLIPDEYRNFKTKVEITPDKKAILEAFKNGESVNGAKLVDDKTTLRIK